MHRLKYNRDVALGEALARPLIGFFRLQGWTIDLVAPVPLGAARLKERGYNQASLLARPLALACGLVYQPKALRKVRDTATQVGLSFEDRWKNVAGAFLANPDLVSGKSILVVDDVTTSGATLDACSQALIGNGARQVFGLTLARAMGKNT